jgi:chromosome segregation ATPase
MYSLTLISYHSLNYQDVNEMKKVSAELKSQAAENQRMMVELNYSVKDNRKDITELFSNFAAVRTELDGVQAKLLEISELRTLIKDQRTIFDVMKYCQRDLEDLNNSKKNHEARIMDNTEAITTKADATVAFAVQTLDKDVLAIKNHLKQEEDQGISVSSFSRVATLSRISLFTCIYFFMNRPSAASATCSQIQWKACSLASPIRLTAVWLS